jgi:hypothetical protein
MTKSLVFGPVGWYSGVPKLVFGVVLGLLLFSSEAFALCNSYPNTFATGTTADGSQVLANFNCAALTQGATIDAATLTSATLNSAVIVGIGVASPSYKLHVVGGTGTVSLIKGTNNTAYSTSTYNGVGTLLLDNGSTTAGTGAGIAFSVAGAGPGSVASIAGISTAADYSTALVFQTRSSGGTDGERMRITAAGNVGIGTTSPGYMLHVNGSVAGVGTYNNVSDARLKKNVVPLSIGLGIISQLQPVRFDWRTTDEREVGKELNLPKEHQIGFVAQDVAKVLPEAVSTALGKDAIMSIAESKVVPVLVAAVKELKAANDNQAAQIANLEGQMAVMQRRLNQQAARR